MFLSVSVCRASNACFRTLCREGSIKKCCCSLCILVKLIVINSVMMRVCHASWLRRYNTFWTFQCIEAAFQVWWGTTSISFNVSLAGHTGIVSIFSGVLLFEVIAARSNIRESTIGLNRHPGARNQQNPTGWRNRTPQPEETEWCEIIIINIVIINIIIK